MLLFLVLPVFLLLHFYFYALIPFATRIVNTDANVYERVLLRPDIDALINVLAQVVGILAAIITVINFLKKDKEKI